MSATPPGSDRFQPAPESLVKPPASIPQNPGPSVPQAGTETKDAFQDPNAQKFMAEFWSGIGSKRLVLAAPNDQSANFAAFFVALQHFPAIHTFGVWRLLPDGKVGECACFVAMANILPFCSQELAELTGKKIATPAVPIITAEAGFEELGKKLKDNTRGGGVRT